MEVSKAFNKAADIADDRNNAQNIEKIRGWLRAHGMNGSDDRNVEKYYDQAMAELNLSESSSFGNTVKNFEVGFTQSSADFAERYVPLLASAAVGGLAAGGMITAQTAKGITALNSRVFSQGQIKSPLEIGQNILTDQPGYQIIPQNNNQNNDSLMAAYLANQNNDTNTKDNTPIIVGFVIAAIVIILMVVK
ncbi:MAG: hypothetical protein WAU36_10330 [Cyclobacteriaceae bacterium]